PGAPTGAPFTSTLPAVARSKPATRLRMVDLPQPLGPTIAANCPWATVRSTSSRARTGLAPPNTLVTPASSMAFGMLGPSVGSADMAPAQQPVLQRDQQAVGEEAEHAD